MHQVDLAADTASNRADMLGKDHQVLSKAERAQLVLTRWKRQAFLEVVMKHAPVTSGLKGTECQRENEEEGNRSTIFRVSRSRLSRRRCLYQEGGLEHSSSSSSLLETCCLRGPVSTAVCLRKSGWAL